MGKRRGVSFGKLLRQVPIEDIAESYGISDEACVSWMDSLGLPILYIGGRRLVNLAFFILAVHAITRIGAPDFYVAPERPPPKGDTLPLRVTHRTELDPEEVVQNYYALCAELLYGAHLFGTKTANEYLADLEKGVRKLARFAIHRLPKEEMDLFTQQAIRHMYLVNRVARLPKVEIEDDGKREPPSKRKRPDHGKE